MNLHGMVSGIVGAINPKRKVLVRRNSGTYSTASDGTQTPNYFPDAHESLQIQALSVSELRNANEMNITGVLRNVWGNGKLTGVDRESGKGGDILLFDDAVWLVVNVPEQWPDWFHAIVQKQVD